jgi:MFS superfamily sulfate permease-like transporter
MAQTSPSPASTLLPDLVAGLSLVGLLLPEAIAYAQLANLPVQAGVVAMFAGLLGYALVGRGRFAIVSATSSSAAVLGAAVAAVGDGNPAHRAALAAVIVCGAGLAFLLAAAARLGTLSNLIARPVLRGYAFGLAIVITLRQLPVLAGSDAVHGGPFAQLTALFGTLGEWHWASIVCGLVALGLLFAGRLLPRLPVTLGVVAFGIALSPWLARHEVMLAGPLQLGIAMPQFALPARGGWLDLSEYALALMFIAYAESYGSIRTFALRHDETVRPDRDLAALGVANLASGLLQGMAVGAGYSATAANEAAGARSRRAGLVAAAVALVVILVLPGLVERIPRPILAAIVVHALSGSLRVDVFADYFRWHRDRLVALTAVAAVLLLGVLNGLLAAIAFSLIMLLRTLASPRLAVLGRVGGHDYVDVRSYPQAQTRDDLVVLRPEEPLFFANVEPLLALARDQVVRHARARIVVLSLEESPDLDGTTLEALAAFCDWLDTRGRRIRVARLKDGARDALSRAQLAGLTGAALEHASVDDAVRGEAIGGRRG